MRQRNDFSLAFHTGNLFRCFYFIDQKAVQLIYVRFFYKFLDILYFNRLGIAAVGYECVTLAVFDHCLVNFLNFAAVAET